MFQVIEAWGAKLQIIIARKFQSSKWYRIMCVILFNHNVCHYLLSNRKYNELGIWFITVNEVLHYARGCIHSQHALELRACAKQISRNGAFWKGEWRRRKHWENCHQSYSSSSKFFPLFWKQIWYQRPQNKSSTF